VAGDRARERVPVRQGGYRLKYATDEERAEGNRLRQRRFNLRASGWTLDEWNEAFRTQAGKCAICRRGLDATATRSASAAHADHDHTTGDKRELLCSNCNRGVGCFLDDPILLRAAAEYIERHR
jgi:hypothetical protein